MNSFFLESPGIITLYLQNNSIKNGLSLALEDGFSQHCACARGNWEIAGENFRVPTGRVFPGT